METMNVKTILEERIPRLQPLVQAKGYTLGYQEKVTNHEIVHGIRIWKDTKEKSNIGVVMYYEESSFSKSDYELAQELIRLGESIPEIPLQVLEDPQYILDHVKPMILSLDNEEAMKHSPYYVVKQDPFLLLFYVPMELGNQGEGHVKLTKELVKSHRFFEEELLEYAMEHATEDLMIRSMQELLSEMLGGDFPVEEPGMPMYVVTNHDSNLGAVGILLPEAYEKLSQILGSAFVVLPSSLHECICVPYADDKEQYRSMVEEVNSTQVALPEQLSNHVYLRDREGIRILA